MKKGSGFCHGKFDLIQQRRLESAQEFERRKARAARWYHENNWTLSGQPCYCGRGHWSIVVDRELQCPNVWWGWVKFFFPDFMSWEEVQSMVRDPRIPEGVPDEEVEHWVKFFKEQGEAALKALDKHAPHIAERVREALREKQAVSLEHGRKILRPETEEI